jgi:hypothetical protein
MGLRSMDGLFVGTLLLFVVPIATGEDDADVDEESEESLLSTVVGNCASAVFTCNITWLEEEDDFWGAAAVMGGACS